MYVHCYFIVFLIYVKYLTDQWNIYSIVPLKSLSLTYYLRQIFIFLNVLFLCQEIIKNIYYKYMVS